MTDYVLESRCCGTQFEDGNWELECPNTRSSALIFARYKKKQLTVHEDLPGIYKFSDWLPINRILKGSGSPVTYKSEALAKHLGLTDLYITFNGYWKERGAAMLTGTFKECEAFSVCARVNNNAGRIMVVASAGNTARAFARVCSENKIPLLICIPDDCSNAMWFAEELDPCVKVIATERGSDYFDAIHLSNVVCELERFYPEGGAKNVARRDGMGTTVLSAVTTIGRIPDYYFQAVGSGTGAIAAWEANQRFIEDGRYGTNYMRLMVSQNKPFTPIYDAWKADSREMLLLDDDVARGQVEEICAKVLSNRKPPYPMKGGLYDALKATDGDVLLADNEEAFRAADLFEKLEGVDIEPAAAVATATLINAIEDNKVEKDATIMLNITGGGSKLFKAEHNIIYKKPDIIFSINAGKDEIFDKVNSLFGFK
ncbi:MAG: cysteate synthase [Culturomica sp.]|nr:cysteate synthase [Culturomica sp.]